MRPPVLFTVAALALSLAGSLWAPGPGGSPDPARSVDPHVTVVSDVLVGRPGPLPYTEPHLAVHPDDPDRLLAVAIVGYSRSAGRASWDCALMRSDDGGRSWVEERLGIGRCADPWVILTGDTAWVAALGDATSIGGSRGVAVLRSPDGGGSWEPLDSLPAAHDHPTLVLARTGGVHLVSIYNRGRDAHVITGQVGGPGPAHSPRLQRIPDRINTEEPVDLPDGTLLIPVHQFSRWVGEGMEWIDPPRSGSVRYDPSTGQFGPLVPITQRCGNRKGFSAAAVDRSGDTHDGRIYFACPSHRGGDIIVAWSDDDGVSWEEPVQVLGVPDPDEEGTPLRMAVGLAVSGNGTVGVVWQDREGQPDRRCQVQRFAASVDGGRTFSAPVTTSSEASCPFTRANAESARMWPAGTHYGALVGLPGGVFRSVWADARSGVYQIRMGTVVVR